MGTWDGETLTVERFGPPSDEPGGIARHEAAIRDLWGGPVCVIEGGVPLQELEQIRTEVQDEVQFSWSNVDEIGGTVEIGMHVVDPELQAEFDRRYGEGVVELHGNLQPVE